MKKILLFLFFILLFSWVVIISCSKNENSIEKKQQPFRRIQSVVYYSPDQNTPYSCYTPCLNVPNPTGLNPVSNSGTVIQISVEGLTYTNGFLINYADSIQYVFEKQASKVIWTEKWCNTNGAFIPLNILDSLCNSSGMTNRNNLLLSVIPYGLGIPGTVYSTNINL